MRSRAKFNPSRAEWALFRGMYPSAASLAQVAQTWVKPKNASLIYVLAIGAGAGGGAGSAVVAGASGGGSGGLSGNVTALVISAKLVPPILYVYVPLGGAGSIGSGAVNGNPSYVSSVPGAQAAAQCLLASSAVGTLASAGLDAVTGTGGNSTGGNSPATAVDFVLGSLGRWNACGSGGNSNGGSGAAGMDISRADNGAGANGMTILTAGAGGGGVTAGLAATNGGSIVIGTPGTIVGPTTLGGGVAGAAIDGNNGLDLLSLLPGNKPWLFTGGAGGASSITGFGGRGGKGGTGCGGGGGGGSSISGDRGSGGDGGSGLVMIGWW